ncbi:sugar phosphate isomerase/epimerase [Promicromonospora sp. AC04]|uniref:galactose-binding domain-containing protein n=1 Tax=Promicromonospora sp. AC04 TaxID=2135723 RepID=UPI000D4CA7EC|nr:discoidin domain-containing protein [Promicromonospora sp. AC04]PUB32445.1 sugar phosphate isomerase/epimerase [Promicromonospora sp. AC04]
MHISLHSPRARRLTTALAGSALLAGTFAGSPAVAAPSTPAAPTPTTTAAAACGEEDGLPDSKISIQLFTHVGELGFGTPAPETIDRVLGEVANAGFTNIEPFSQPYSMPVDEYKAILDRHGLEVSSSHGSTDWDTWPDTVDYAVALGQDYIGTGGMAGNYGTYEEALATAAYVNQLGQYAHENGANKIVLHNHQSEFTTRYPHPETGEMVSAWQVIEANTDPRYVTFQLDVGWAADAGIDVPAWIEEYGDRIELLHVKDAVNVNAEGDPRQVALGNGDIDLPAIIAAAEPYVEYYTYEWDYAPSFESSAESYQYLRCYLSDDGGNDECTDEDGESLALGRPVTTSSIDDPSRTGDMAVDGNAGTRWGSQWSEPEWIAVDLGASYDLSRIVIDWETAYASGYEIQTSPDGETWTTVHTVTDGDGLFDNIDLSGTGQHVRLYATERATQWGFSLYELEVYGTPGGQPTPEPVTRSAAYWTSEYRQVSNPDYTTDELLCFLSHTRAQSDVFDEVVDLTTMDDALQVLWARNHDEPVDVFDRQLLSLWLNVAAGSVALEDPLVGGGTVGDLLLAIEAARLDAGATWVDLKEYKKALEAVNTQH